MARRSPSLRLKASNAVWLVGILIGAVLLLGSPDDRDGSTSGSSAEIDKISRLAADTKTAQSSIDEGQPYEVTASSLRLRANPSTGAAIRGAAGRGERVAVLGRQGDWLDVRLEDGSRGWMYGDHLTPSDAPMSRSVARDPEVPASRSNFTDAVGRATITDGDTISIGGVNIRLHGIDTSTRTRATPRRSIRFWVTSTRVSCGAGAAWRSSPPWLLPGSR